MGVYVYDKLKLKLKLFEFESVYDIYIYICFVKAAMYTYFIQMTAKASRAYDLPILKHHNVDNLHTVNQQLNIHCQIT